MTNGDLSFDTPLFNQVVFHIITSDGLPVARTNELTRILIENGAEEHSPPSRDGKITFDGLSHIISASIDFEGYDAAETRMLAIVTPSWVEISVVKKRLANPKSHSPDPRLFFSGLVVCTAELPEGDKDAIIGGVLAMGGLYSGAISKLVTHIVALNMEPQACKVAIAKNLQCKIVLPHWFDDCIRLGRRIKEGPYLLPDPEIMRSKASDQILSAIKPDLSTALSTRVGSLLSPESTPIKDRKPLSVFKGRRIILSTDLEIAEHLRKTIEGLIRSGGGEIVYDIHDADVLVCQYRDSATYRIASIEDKMVGNLPWLYHLITRNAWTSPLRRLLHYPIARNGLPQFRDYRISLSNYNGEARVYLENLAKAAGCEFTKTMKMENTHLITAHLASEKCEAAKEWNIHMINHLWLEESYAKWKVQSITNPRYTHFPSRTNLGEVVGQTHIDKQALEPYFFPRATTNKMLGDPNGSGFGDSERVQKDNNKDIANHRAPTPSETLLDQPPVKGSPNTALPTSKISRKIGHARETSTVKTPAGKRASLGEKETETPSTTGSRGAKERAAAKIHDLAPDIALYEKELKRVGGVTHGGRKLSADLVVDISKKRATPGDDQSDSDLVETDRPLKRAKRGRAPPIMRLLVTGYSRWADDDKQLQRDKDRLRDFGILLTTDFSSCTHLAAPRILRTKKFVCAMARAPTVLSTDFVEDCLKRNQLLPTQAYLLEDVQGEKRYSIKLSEAVLRAQTNRGRLLQGQTIYVTENIFGGFDTYKSIVEANGGKCLLYKARAGSSFVPVRDDRTINNDQEDLEEDPEYVYLVSGTSTQEAKLWPRFRQLAKENGVVSRIASTDWMLDLALSQQIRWDDVYEITNSSVESKD